MQALLIALWALAASAWAQTYPAKPVRVVVPFAPGGVLGIEPGVTDAQVKAE